jgi:hypothetical protein
MKSHRKAGRDRSKRDAARDRPRVATEADGGDEADTPLDEVDDQIARSVLGYDE